MTRALPITQHQAQVLLRAAEAEKAIIEVKVGDTVFRLIPATLAQAAQPIDESKEPEKFTTLEQYRAWRERQRAGGA